MKNFKFFPKNEPGLVLNLFLIFGENPASCSYKLCSYKKKNVYLKKANLRDGESIADDERLESVVIHFEKSFRVENFFRVHVDLTQALLRQLFLVVEFRLNGEREKAELN